jgi:hypothetical protein
MVAALGVVDTPLTLLYLYMKFLVKLALPESHLTGQGTG